jgi:hypothetical protein
LFTHIQTDQSIFNEDIFYGKMGCDHSVPVEPNCYTVQKPGAGNKKNVIYGKTGCDHSAAVATKRSTSQKYDTKRNDETSNYDPTPFMYNQWMLGGAFNDTTTLAHTSTHCVSSATMILG